MIVLLILSIIPSISLFKWLLWSFLSVNASNNGSLDILSTLKVNVTSVESPFFLVIVYVISYVPIVVATPSNLKKLFLSLGT